MKGDSILLISAIVVFISLVGGLDKGRTTTVGKEHSQLSLKKKEGLPLQERPLLLEEISSFEIHAVEKGDSFYGLFGPRWESVSRINRISPQALKPGMILLAPDDFNRHEKTYSPLPATIEMEAKLLIDLGKQVIGRYEDGKLQKWHPISSGKEGHRTPTGHFRISQKVEHYKSKTYPKPDGGAPMPYAMNFYKGYWIHAGRLPGYPASHGCIRLIEEDARRLFHNIQIGDAVLVL
jgi:hypothetical protein